MNEIERKNRYNRLLALYGRLLSDLTCLDLTDYYGQDLSLSEIAANRHVSRNAVYICLRRGEKELDALEGKLGLAAKSEKLIARLSALIEETDNPKLEKALADMKEELENGI